MPIEWLAEVIYARAYRLAGYGGVAALVTAALMALHAIVYLNASRWVRAALLPIVAMDFVLIPMLLARPHVLTWPLLAFWTWLMLRAREQDRAPPLVAALLMALVGQPPRRLRLRPRDRRAPSGSRRWSNRPTGRAPSVSG